MFGGGTRGGRDRPGPLGPVEGRPRGRRADRWPTSHPGTRSCSSSRATPAPKRAAMLQALEAAVLKAGGEASDLPGAEGRGAGRLAGQPRGERGVVLERDAAQELARRVGGFVTRG